MPFSYNSTNPDKIVFTRLGAGCGRFVAFTAGIIFSITGVFLIYFMRNAEMPFAFLKYLVPAFGILGIYMGIKLPEIQRKTIPDEIIFDNINGRVEVNQKNSEVNTAYIYYDEIEDFVSIAKKQSDSTNSNKTLSTYTHHIQLTKKDGGQWELLKMNQEQAAINEIAKLKSLIKLDVSPKRVTVNAVPSKKYTITKGQQKVELNWRNKVGFGPLILGVFAFVFAGVFYAIADSFFATSADLPIFAYLVGGFMVTIFLIVIIGNAMKMVKNAKTDYALVITKGSLIYIEKDRSGRIKKEDRYPFEELHSIAYSFDSEEAIRKIYIHTKKQQAQKPSAKPTFSLEYIKSVIAYQTSLHSLEIQSLTPVEALHIENYLQEQILKIGNAEVA